MKTQNDGYMDISEEYNIQYFSFSRSVLRNSLSSLVESKLQSQIESAKSYFAKLELAEGLKEKVNEKCSNLLTIVSTKSQSALHNIFVDLDTHFHVPDNVLLPQDEMFKNNVDEEDVNDLKNQIDELKMKIMALNASQIVIEKELAENSTVKGYIALKEQQLLNTLNGLQAVLLTGDSSEIWGE